MNTDIIRQPEGKTLEFKQDISSPLPILRTLTAFANTAGGRVFIGVADDGTVSGVENPFDEEERICNMIADSISPRLVPDIELMTIEGKTVMAVRVFLSSLRPHYIIGEGPEKGVYVRLGSTNRQADRELIEELRRNAAGCSFDEMPMQELGIRDVDIKEASKFFGLPHKINAETLTTLRLLTDNQGRKVPTKGAVILFGKNRERYFPDAWIQCGRFAGSDKSIILDSFEIHENLPESVSMIMEFFKKHSLRGIDFSDIQTDFSARNKDVWSLPTNILREAAINAVVHADYSQRGAPIRVSIFDDRIEIENPGILVPGMTIDDMLSGVSKIRNPVIARVFKEIRLIEQWGSGIGRMMKEAAKLGLPAVQFVEIGTRMRTIIFLTAQRQENGKRTARERQENGKRTAEERQELNLSDRLLQALVNKELGRTALASALGHKSVSGELNRRISELLKTDMIEMTQPDKPTSRLQRYRITQKGAAHVAKLRSGKSDI